jgi:hypothetical protein
VVFGSTVKSAVTRRGVSYSRRLAIGVEGLEEESCLFLAERRYYSIYFAYLIEFSWSGLLRGLVVSTIAGGFPPAVLPVLGVNDLAM